MKTLLLVLSFIGLNAFAYQDITCWEKDCLNKGWTSIETSTNQYLDFQCYRDGCKVDGWIVGGSLNQSYYTQCKEGGCFVNGWFEVDRSSKLLLKEIVCEKNNCLTEGWTTYLKNQSLKTSCTQNNCSTHGWTSGRQTVICKKGGCFTEGRIESGF